jgi:hypothetical protein
MQHHLLLHGLTFKQIGMHSPQVASETWD